MKTALHRSPGFLVAHQMQSNDYSLLHLPSQLQVKSPSVTVSPRDAGGRRFRKFYRFIQHSHLTACSLLNIALRYEMQTVSNTDIPHLCSGRGSLYLKRQTRRHFQWGKVTFHNIRLDALYKVENAKINKNKSLKTASIC